MAKFVELASPEALTDFMNANEATGCVVTYSATWCGPCKACKPRLRDEIAARSPVPIGYVYESDLDPEFFDVFVVVSAFPTFVFYRGGREISRVEGVDLEAVEAMARRETGIITQPAEQDTDDVQKPETTNLSWQSLHELASMVHNGETTSMELVQKALARIDSVDKQGGINAVVVRNTAQALAKAAEIDALSAAQKHQMPLAGVPITIKEHLNVAGLPTTVGDPTSSKDPVPHSARVVVALEEAGAIVVGKTNNPIFCADYQSYNALYGRTNNPHDLSRSPGGSSGGSAAAVAAGLVPLCIGTDIGGSVRVPAHCCGVFAHKPTWGLISKDTGTGRDLPKAMSTTGPIARCAKDLTLVTELLVENAREPFGGLFRAKLPEVTVKSLEGCKIALWKDDPVCPVDEAVTSALNATVELLQSHGAIVTSAKPNVDSSLLLDCYRDLVGDAMEGTNGTRSHADHLASTEVQCAIRAAFDDFLGHYDVMLTPSFPVVAFPHDDEDQAHHPFYRGSDRTLDASGKPLPYHLGCFWPAVANLTLLPATAFPVLGETEASLPVALQLVGRELADGTCLRVAELLEEAGKGTRVAQFRKPARLND